MESTAQLIPEEITTNIRERVNYKYTPGMVLIFFNKGQTELFQFGNTDYIQKNKVDENTVFEIGSLTKTFTTLLLALSVEKGLLLPDDPVQRYLPKTVKIPTRNGKEITFRHLATHSSALPRLPDNLDLTSSDPYADYDEKKLFEFLNSYQLKREPGKEYEYSNLGMGLLGHTLAMANKKSYPELLNEWIFKPLQMNHSQTGTTFQDEAVNIALPHLDEQPVAMWNFKVISGAGAIKSSAKDLLHYLKAQMGYEQSPLSKAMRFTQEVQKEVDKSTTVALGWHLTEKNGRKITWHNGGTGGSSSFMGFDPLNQKGVVILSNSTHQIDDLGWNMLCGEMLQKLKKTVSLTKEVLQKYVAVYDFGQGFKISVFLNNEQLMAQAKGQEDYPIYADKENRFFFKVVEAELEFVRNEKGIIDKMILYQNGTASLAKRE